MRQYKYPFFISPHAVNRFRERVANIWPAEVIDFLQAFLQHPPRPVQLEYRDSMLIPIFRGYYEGRVFYCPVVKGEGTGGWPCVPTVNGANSPIHWNICKNKEEYLYGREKV